MRSARCAVVVLIVMASWLALDASQGAPSQQQRPAGGRGGFTSAPSEPAQLLFHESWTRAPMSQPMVQDNLGSKNLDLHIYGNANEIRKAFHPEEDYTYTGETVTNWALTLSDPKFYYDLSGTGKVMLRTRNSGYRFTHVVLKTLDGKWYASEEGSPESTSWIEREYALSDLHWRILLMTDTPSNASNRRQPDPKLVPIIPMGVGRPDLAKVDEIGFSDLMPGGWIPSTSRVNSWKVFGKKVPR